MGIRLTALKAKHFGPLATDLGCVIQDGGVYRSWSGERYLESDDGYNWRSRPINRSPGMVFKDPSAPTSERYKGVYLADTTPEQFTNYKKARPGDWQWLATAADPGRVHAIHGVVSPDGLNWELLPAPVSVEHSDTHVVAYYDQRLEKYVMYTRNYPAGPRSERVPYEEFRVWEATRRSIGRTDTDDFRRFPISEVVLEPTPDMAPSDMLYANGRTAIPGAPDHHLMFASIWHSAMNDTTSTAVASSHDGKIWHWVPGPRVIETASFGEWDGGCIFVLPNLVELPSGDFALPYFATNVPHKYPRGQLKSGTGYAIWPKGRVVALEAPEYGEFATVALVPPGRKLKVNAATNLAGSISVEVAHWDYSPVRNRSFADCIPLRGDLFWKMVTWKSGEDLGHKDGDCVILRFRMHSASIFGLEFE
ncbi:MAG: hypothetical protein ACPL7K_05770, partial [Armatimonadota bacterium]